MQKVITRFPPSPTGLFHVGSARTALFNYLFAKKHGGEFILRFEDTDRERSKKEYEDDILEGLQWLSLAYDNDTIERQSERTDLYTQYLKQLLESGAAYEAEENTEKTGAVIRFKNPKKEVAFDDMVRGNVSVDTTDLDDFVIAKSITEPLYHLTVVVDDHEMGITHIIRGEDHISNTPRQILIQEALGFLRPLYAHIPLILGEDRSKLSKRHGAVSVNAYREKGYLPDAFVNFLALLGWHPRGEREIFTLKELVELFELKDVQKGGAIFNEEKLRWLNGEHIRTRSDDELVEALRGRHPYGDDGIRKVLPIVRERIEVLGDIEDMVEKEELAYFFEAPKFSIELLVPKDENEEDTAARLSEVLSLVQELPDSNFESASIKEVLWGYATEEGRGKVLWPMRYALSGKERSPDPFQIAEIIGKEETLKRLQNAIHELQMS